MKTLRALCLVLVCATGLSYPVAATAQTALIAGHVTDAVTGAPLSGVIVHAYNNADTLVAVTMTDASGAYAISGLADGIHHVRTFADLLHQDELFNNLACGSCPVNTGNPIMVVSGGPTQIADFALGPRLGQPITGTVRALGGAPLAGVSIWVYDAQQTLVASALTLPDGTYTTGLLYGPGPYYVRTYNTLRFLDEVYNDKPCSLGCALLAGTPVPLLIGIPGPPVDFILQPAGTISGRITSAADGSGIPHVTVLIRDVAGAPVATTVSGGDGSYESPGLPDGTYRVRTSNAQGFLDEAFVNVVCVSANCGPFDGATIAVSAAASATNIDLALETGASITGTVRAQGTGSPLGGISIEVLSASATLVTTSVTDSNGIYATTGLLAGTYYVRSRNRAGYKDELYGGAPCVAGVCDPLMGVPIALVQGSVTPDIDFSLAKGAQLTGLVLNLSNAGISGITVAVFDTLGGSVTSSVTDLTGRFTTTGLNAGTYYARTVNTLGYNDELYYELTCPVAACAVTAGTPIVVSDPDQWLLNFTLSQVATTGTITGRVIDESTLAPLSGVTVQIVRFLPGPGPLPVVVQNVTTNDQGFYTAQNLAPDTYYAFTANTLGYQNEAYNNIPCTLCSFIVGTPIVVSAGGTAFNIDFALTRLGPGLPSISGHVRRASNGTGIGGVFVQIYTTTGLPAAGVITNPDGSYVVNVPSPGSYFARTLNAPGFVDQLYNGISCQVSCSLLSGTQVPVPPGGVAGINFSLADTTRFSGRVTSATTGAGLPGVLVAVFNNTGGFVSNAFTDGSGNYATFTLVAGTYYAKALGAQGFLDQLYSGVPCALGCTPTDGTPIVVQSGQTTPGINFSLAASARITGNVRLTLGGPVFSLVDVFYDDGTLHFRVFTDASGNYQVRTNLVTGTYFVKTVNSSRHIDEVFDDKICVGCDPTTGTPVLVTEGSTTPAIDFVLAPGGSISGRQTASSTGIGIVGSPTEVFDANGTLVTTAFTDGSGNYATTLGLSSGTYYVRTRNSAGYRDELYDNVPCTFGGCSPLGGAPVTVTAGLPTTGINFSLDQLGRISGTVKNALGQPIVFASVRAYTLNGMLVSSSLTGFPNGQFAVLGLPAGSYYLVASANNFKQQAYDQVDFACLDNCTFIGTPIVVGEGQSVTDINFVLAPGGRIAGQMSDAATEAVLVGIAAEIYDASNTLVARASSDASGNYTSDAGLPSGNYFLRTRNSRGYQDQLHAGLPCHNCVPSSGTPIAVVDGVTTPNVDLQLVQGSRISGSIRANGRALSSNTGFLFNAIDGPGLFVSTAPKDGSGNYLATRNTTLVNVFDSTGAFVTSTTTDGSGNYTTKAGLADGTYYAVTATSAGYINEHYGGQTCLPLCNPLDGTPIQVAGQHVNGINFDLTKGGRIAGTIRDAATGLPLRNLWVDIYDGSNMWVATAYSDSTGAYITNQGLGSGTYFARTRDTLGYRSELYSEGSCAPGTCTPSAGTPIVVTAPKTTSGIDFSLTPGVEETPLSVTVVHPNGGERVFVGVPAMVTWSASGGTGGQPSSFDVLVSTNNGTTFTPIAGCSALPAAALSCAWTPLSASANALIRVVAHDSGGNTASDVSNAVFRIAAGPPVITVRTPNTAVTWGIGSQVTISWNHNLGLDSAVNVELSRDGGGTWQIIVPAVQNTAANTGSTSWIVTGPPTAAALIRVSSVDTPATDVSDVPFTIAVPAVQVTAPNTAVTWRSGTVRNVTFTHNLGIGAEFDLALSRDGGATWSAIGSVTTTSATTGRLTWTVTGPQTTRALIRAAWRDQAAVTDVSDVEFTISPRINVTSPGTAVSWAGGSTREVRWTHNLAATDTVDVDFSADGGTTWTRLATGVPNESATAGRYTGRMPDTLTTNAVIRVTQSGAPAEYDTTPVPFTIAAPALTVTAPNTNVRWFVGTVHALRWTHNLGTAESVRIELSRDAGTTWDVLTPSLQNTGAAVGRFDWTVSGPPSTTALVRVTWTAGNGVSDVSDVTFRIQIP